MFGRTKRMHFVGIGGSGMSGIAELVANLGFEVSGSDLVRTATTDRLAGLGVRVHEGHVGDQVGEADVVVVSSAVRPDNPEVLEARRRRIPVIPRAEMLAELMRLRHGIAVAGAHGKTSTTSMIAVSLEHAGLDPTAVVGGRLSAFGSNARLGRGDYVVVEADESDRSFLQLSPSIAVITNIDHEHLESYSGFEGLLEAFAEFANKVPFYGAVVACADNPHVRRLLPRLTRRVVTYGLEAEDCEVEGHDVALDGFESSCLVRSRLEGGAPRPLGRLRLAVPGRHSLQNALAAVAVALELGIPFARVAAGLAAFRGVERRFHIRGTAGGVTVVDDYAHHPTEIAAVLAAARAGRPRRILAVFQPHRYTRTHRLMNDFGPALGAADVVVLTGIYSAGEDPIPGVTLDALAACVRRDARVPVTVTPSLDAIPELMARLTAPGDLVLLLGAGSIERIVPAVLAALAAPGKDDAGIA